MAKDSWLLCDGTDRERMIDMDSRLRSPRMLSFVVLAGALIACGPWLGWWQLLPLVLAGLAFKAADDHVANTAHPEYWVFAAWAGSVTIIAISVALTGGPSVPMMAWLALPIVTLSAASRSRHRSRRRADDRRRARRRPRRRRATRCGVYPPQR